MRLPPVGLVAVMLLGFLVCGETRRGSFAPERLGEDDGTVIPNFLLRKVLQAQQPAVATKPDDGAGQRSGNQTVEQRWQPKVEEKKDEVPAAVESKANEEKDGKGTGNSTSGENDDQRKFEGESNPAAGQSDLATKLDDKKEEPKVDVGKEEKMEEAKAPEESKSDEKREEVKVEEKREESKSEERKAEPKVEERKEEPKVTDKDVPEEIRVTKLEGESREQPKREENDWKNQETKVEDKQELQWNASKEVDKKDVAEVEENEVPKILNGTMDAKAEENAARQQKGQEQERPWALPREDLQENMQEMSVLPSPSIQELDKLREASIGASTRSDGAVDPGDGGLSEDYPDFLDELRNFPETFQKTAESVKDHIKYAGLDRYSLQSKELFDQANQQMQESFTPLLGKAYAPFLAYVVSYGLLLLPMALVMYFLDRIRARFSLQKILLFVNIYLAAYSAALMAATFLLETEPMDFFMKYWSTSYIFLQLVQALGYLVYLLLNTVDLISTCSNGRVPAKFSSFLQWVVVVAVGFHYYVTVFHRAMVKRPPLASWRIYGLYSLCFVFLCLFTRVERGKKKYKIVEEDDPTDKKN